MLNRKDNPVINKIEAISNHDVKSNGKRMAWMIVLNLYCLHKRYFHHYNRAGALIGNLIVGYAFGTSNKDKIHVVGKDDIHVIRHT